MAELKLRELDRNCLREIHELITKNPFYHFTLESLAYDRHINRTKLSYGFKQLFGIGVYQFQVQLRMERAERLLRESEFPVKSIALMTGYKTASSFTIAFKKKHNLTPYDYRQQPFVSAQTVQTR